jgi:hypothetical protein
MARIPDHEIERLEREISVERLAEARGIRLTRHGADRVPGITSRCFKMWQPWSKQMLCKPWPRQR